MCGTASIYTKTTAIHPFVPLLSHKWYRYSRRRRHHHHQYSYSYLFHLPSMTYSLDTDSIVKENCILLVRAEDRQTYDTNRILTYNFLLNYKLMLPECNFNNTQFVGWDVCGTWKNLGIVHRNFVWCAVMPVWYTVNDSLVNCHYTVLWSEYIVTSSVWCTVVGKLPTDQNAP